MAQAGCSRAKAAKALVPPRTLHVAFLPLS
jgi:hypothetical protein